MSSYLRSELVNAIRQGNAVFIVGAGASLHTTQGSAEASWIGLIEAGVDRCVDLDPALPKTWKRSKLRALRGSDPSQMIQVAQEVEACLKRMPGRHYAKWLSDTVGELRIVDPTLVDALLSSRAPLLTTNYDSLLELGTGREAITWNQFSDMQAELVEPGKSVVHLHGHWRRPETVVFGYDSYAAVIGDPASQAFLRAMLTVKSVVFLGFGQGIADPNFTALTTWLTTVLRSTGVAPVLLVRNQELAATKARCEPLGINAIPYGDDFADLPLYVADMVTEARINRDKDLTVDFGWDSISAKLMRLQRRITRSFIPDFIVATSGPGNFAPAYCLANWGDEPPLLSAVCFPRKPDRSRRNIEFSKVADASEWIHFNSTKWDVYLPNLIRNFPAGSRALIFDDRVVGGRTQPGIAKILEGFGYEVRRAALVVDPSCADSVDFYEEIVDGDFTFPWGGRYGRGERTVS